MTDSPPRQGPTTAFLEERKKARFFFNLSAPIYYAVEWHLFPSYQKALTQLDLPPALTVLDLATGSGILAAAFHLRGHEVVGMDFSEGMLKRARKRFPAVDFQSFDLVDLPTLADQSYDIVSCGYLLHGLSSAFRQAVLSQMARIARKHVVIFDYGRDGGWSVRLIERIEGPYYPIFITSSREEEFSKSGLRLEKTISTSKFGSLWLCSPPFLVKGKDQQSF
jgi:SAM-dependent methyltransferase